MNALEFFENMNQHFKPKAAAGMDVVCQYEFSDDDNHFIVIKDGEREIMKGDHASPTVTVITDIATLVSISNGASAMFALMTGKLKTSGDALLAQKMPTLFSA